MSQPPSNSAAAASAYPEEETSASALTAAPADGYRKDGTDWFAEYPPGSNRILDVQLVHTLRHERYAKHFIQLFR
jgi:hypothetical protein